MSSSHDRPIGRALIWSNLLSEPLFTLYGSLAFILYKGLGATPFQIALLTMLKPLVTVLSFYWSAGLRESRRHKMNVIWAGIWMRLPFLLCPWIDSVWFMIGAAVNYMFFYRAAIPAWLELIKRGVPEGKRERLFSWSAAVGYGEGVVLSLAMGGLLDHNPAMWKGLFALAAFIGLGAVCFQKAIPVEEKEEEPLPKIEWKEALTRPWRDSFQLMRERKDFSRFQWGFMVCGFGIMLIQPALPIFAVDVLEISYLEMAAAVSIAKGLGFVLSSPLWARWMNQASILRVASGVFLCIGLFPFLLSLSSFSLIWFFLAHFWYGVGQGGSHLVWNMSGPIFAGKEESSRFTGVNVVLAGLRGGIAPPLGSLLAVLWGPVGVLAMGSLLSVYSGIALLRKYPEKIPSQ